MRVQHEQIQTASCSCLCAEGMCCVSRYAGHSKHLRVLNAFAARCRFTIVRPSRESALCFCENVPCTARFCKARDKTDKGVDYKYVHIILNDGLYRTRNTNIRRVNTCLQHHKQIRLPTALLCEVLVWRKRPAVQAVQHSSYAARYFTLGLALGTGLNFPAKRRTQRYPVLYLVYESCDTLDAQEDEEIDLLNWPRWHCDNLYAESDRRKQVQYMQGMPAFPEHNRAEACSKRLRTPGHVGLDEVAMWSKWLSANVPWKRFERLHACNISSKGVRKRRDARCGGRVTTATSPRVAVGKLVGRSRRLWRCSHAYPSHILYWSFVIPSGILPSFIERQDRFNSIRIVPVCDFFRADLAAFFYGYGSPLLSPRGLNPALEK